MEALLLKLQEEFKKITEEIQQQLLELEERICLLEHTVYGSNNIYDDDASTSDEEMRN